MHNAELDSGVWCTLRSFFEKFGPLDSAVWFTKRCQIPTAYILCSLPRMDQPSRRPMRPPISANSSDGPVMKYSFKNDASQYLLYSDSNNQQMFKIRKVLNRPTLLYNVHEDGLIYSSSNVIERKQNKIQDKNKIHVVTLWSALFAFKEKTSQCWLSALLEKKWIKAGNPRNYTNKFIILRENLKVIN